MSVINKALRAAVNKDRKTSTMRSIAERVGIGTTVLNNWLNGREWYSLSVEAQEKLMGHYGYEIRKKRGRKS